MLTDTLAAGKSVLPGVTATDPALVTATVAFVNELSRVAPTSVRDDWKTLGSVIVALAKSGGRLASVQGVDNKAVAKAVTAVAGDAKTACGIDLSLH